MLYLLITLTITITLTRWSTRLKPLTLPLKRATSERVSVVKTIVSQDKVIKMYGIRDKSVVKTIVTLKVLNCILLGSSQRSETLFYEGN